MTIAREISYHHNLRNSETPLGDWRCKRPYSFFSRREQCKVCYTTDYHCMNPMNTYRIRDQPRFEAAKWPWKCSLQISSTFKILLQRSFFQNFRYFIRFLFRISWKNFKNIKKDVIRVRSIFQHIFKRCFSSTNTRTLVALIRNYYWFRTFLVLSSVFRFQTFDQLPIKNS